MEYLNGRKLIGKSHCFFNLEDAIKIERYHISIMMELGILGAGSAGTSLATHLRDNYRIHLWDIEDRRLKLINQGKHDLLDQAVITDSITAHKDLNDFISSTELNVLAVPSQAVKQTCDRIKGRVKEESVMVCFSKGFDPESEDLLFNLVEERLPEVRPVVFSGPTHAEEIVLGKHTGAIIASHSEALNQEVIDVFSADNFKLETSLDPEGVQLGAALKNPLAIFIGIVEGLGLGDNARALYMHQAFQEMKELGSCLGAKEETLDSLAGLGDFLVTATSEHSRNWTFGYKLGQIRSKKEVSEQMEMVVEGISSSKIAYEKTRENDLDLPIIETIYRILHRGEDPKKAIDGLIKEF